MPKKSQTGGSGYTAYAASSKERVKEMLKDDGQASNKSAVEDEVQKRWNKLPEASQNIWKNK